MPRTEPKREKRTPSTTRLTLTLTNELKEALVKKAVEMFGDRKGSISAYVEMQLRNTLGLAHELVVET